MSWEKFRELDEQERIKILCPSLLERLKKCYAKFRKHYPDLDCDDDEAWDLCLYIIDTSISSKWIHNPIPPRANLPKLETLPPASRETHGDRFLFLMAHYHPLCFGYRVGKKRDSTGLFRIVYEYWQGDKKDFEIRKALCTRNYSGQKIHAVVADLEKMGHKDVTAEALITMIHRAMTPALVPASI